jgi:outer membrane biosynthesis protein TonB
MARGQRRKGRLWGWFTLSVLAHAGLGATALVVRSRMPVRPPEKIYVVDLLPPAGTLNGDVQGKGTPLSFPKPAPAAPKAAAPKPAAPTAPHEPVAKPAVHSDAAEPAPAPTKTDKEKQAEELREAVRRSMLKTEETPPEAEHKGPEGTGDKPPLGTPEGVPGGKGKAGMAASYKAVLAGWFVARLSCRSVSDVPPEELKKLTARADIGLSPGRTVTSFSVASSGNDAYDAHVRSMLQSIQSQGITLPESPEGDDPPPHLTVNFRCNKG